MHYLPGWYELEGSTRGLLAPGPLGSFFKEKRTKKPFHTYVTKISIPSGRAFPTKATTDPTQKFTRLFQE